MHKAPPAEIEKAQQQLTRLLASYPKIDAPDRDTAVDVWRTQFLNLAKSVWRDRAKVVTTTHLSYAEDIFAKKLVDVLELEQLCQRAGWSPKESQQLRPRLSSLHDLLLGWCQRQRSSISPPSIANAVPQITDAEIEHQVNAITKLWQDAQTGKHQEKVLDVCLSGLGEWVITGLLRATKDAFPTLKRWMDVAQFEPWWSEASEPFWKNCDREMKTSARLADLVLQADRQKWIVFCQDEEIQSFLNSMPTPTPRAKGVLSLISLLTDADCAPWPAADIQVSSKWADMSDHHQLLVVAPDAVSKISSAVAALKSKSALTRKLDQSHGQANGTSRKM